MKREGAARPPIERAAPSSTRSQGHFRLIVCPLASAGTVAIRGPFQQAHWTVKLLAHAGGPAYPWSSAGSMANEHIALAIPSMKVPVGPLFQPHPVNGGR